MSDIAIKVEGLSKRYRIGAREQGYRTFRETLAEAVQNPFRRLAALGRTAPEAETFWALKDISFEVKKGEVLGIIGRNGAGKSTLLKILSRITVPTSGTAELRGRVGSLLEIGTGFHPELSGRENIYLYGAILGMSSIEISRKFAEIVAFAEIEKFMDTPVKRYSSGMYMRLAFSVAAHLEPEILLVDEVLAVGDAIFQRKCMKKMSKAAAGGRTVLFISHNMTAVSSLCSSAIVVDSGKILYSGPTQTAVSKYLERFEGPRTDSMKIRDRTDRSGNGSMRITDFYVLDESGSKIEDIQNGKTVQLVFEYETKQEEGAGNVEFQFVVSKHSGEQVFQFGTRFIGLKLGRVPRTGKIVCKIKRLPLVPENYRLDAYLVSEAQAADYVQCLAGLNVLDGDFYGSGYQIFEKESRFLVDGEVFLA
jgi:lipopolysaccharide transport system ATP-binding protein